MGVRVSFSVVVSLALIPASWLVAAPAFGAAELSIAPITWNIVGLDSNDVSAGPDHFPVGARVCNTGDVAATNVTAIFVWDSANPLIGLRPGTLTSFTGADAVPVLDPGTCTDFYFEVEISRDPAAYDTTRRYHVEAGADAPVASVSTPTPRELYVEHLISQARNDVAEVRLDGVSIPSGGTMSLVVGQTYTIDLIGSTATNGYEQLESFINFPNTVFRVLSVSTTYTADTSPNVENPSDKLWGDACVWENHPDSPYYRSCRNVGKVGGGVTVSYEIEVLAVPETPIGNPESLSSLLFDFSGSSFHYNADFGVSSRVVAVVDPSTLTLEKSFNPDPTNVGGISTLTFTITNPNPAPVSGVSFTDTLPTSPGAMVVADPAGATINGCGAATFAPVAGSGSLSFSGGTVAANSSCTVKVNVTAPVTGTYTNTSGPLLVDVVDTGSTATDTLDVDDTPPPPPQVCGLQLALWNFPTGFSLTSPAPYAPATSVAASASPGAGLISTQSSQNHTATPAGTVSWSSNGGFDSTGPLNTAFNDYFELAVDTSGLSQVDLSFWARRPNGNAPEQVSVYYGTSPTPPGTLHTTLGNPPTTLFPSAQNTWESSGTLSFTSGLNPSGLTYFRIYGSFASNNNPGSDLILDDVAFTGCGAPQPLTIAKSFAPDPVAVGGASTLTFTITNPNAGTALSGIAFDDTLPAGVTVASGGSSQCGGTLTLTAPSTLSFAGGTLAGGASCNVTAPVAVVTAGPHDNVSGFVSSTETGTNTGPDGVATDSISAVSPPGIAKQFDPDPVLAGGVSTLTFTLTNPNTSLALSGVAFDDTLPVAPGAMVVAPAPAATTSGCGSPTFAPTPGSGSIAFSGGSITAGGTCIVTLDVVAPVAGQYANTSGAVSHLVDGVPVTGGTASDTLGASPASPAIALLKQVGPTASGPWSPFLATAAGADVFYLLTVENIGNVPLSSIDVTDPQVNVSGCSWPATLPVASPTEDPTATCVVGPVTALAGSHPNTATASGTNGTTVTDESTATYATTGLTIVKSAQETEFTTAGDVLHYEFLVTNSGAAAIAGPVTIDDDRATDESCPPLGGIGDLDDFFDPAESVTCTATYTVTPADVTAGFVTNVASASADGVTSNTDTVTVPHAGTLSPPAIAKAFAPNPIAPGETSTLTFTIANPNAGTALTGVAFTDTFPAGMEVASPPNAVISGCGSPTFAPVAGSGSVSFSNGTVASGGTCTVSVDVTATLEGDLVNTTGAVTSTNGGTGNSGSDTLIVVAEPPAVAAVKESEFDPVLDDLDGNGVLSPGDTLSYAITIANTGAGDAENVVFSDTPGANTALVSGSVTASQGSVTTGNGAGDTSVEVALGTLPGTTGQATVTFVVQLDDPFPPGVESVANQGFVDGDGFPTVPTDDPASPPSGDPTVDPVTIEPAGPTPEIPTLSAWALALLALALGAAAALRLRAL